MPIVRKEIEDLAAARCVEICVDEPSTTPPTELEQDTRRFVDIFNRTVEPARDKAAFALTSSPATSEGTRSDGGSMHRCSLPSSIFTRMKFTSRWRNREYAELEIIKPMSEHYDVAVGIIDVKSHHIETVDQRPMLCVCVSRHARADRLVFAPDCGLSQTARWAAKQKLIKMVEEV